MTDTDSSAAKLGSHYLNVSEIPWQPTRFPGIDMKVLWQDPESEAFTAMFRAAPGARLPRHRHQGIEQTFVIEGSLTDEDGVCTAGNFVWRDVGSVHSAHTTDGCLSIGIFQRLNEFLEDVESPADNRHK